MNFYFIGDLTVPAIIGTVGVLLIVGYTLYRASKKRISIDELEDFTERWKGEK